MVSFKLWVLAEKIVGDLFEASEQFPPDAEIMRNLAYKQIDRIEETEGCDELLMSGDVLSRTVQSDRIALSARDLALMALKDILKESANIEVEHYARKYRSRQLNWEAVLDGANDLGLTASNWRPVHDFVFLAGVRDNIYNFAEAVGEYYSYVCAEDEDALIPEEVTRLARRLAEVQPISVGLPIGSSFEEWSKFYHQLMYLYYQLNSYIAEYADDTFYEHIVWSEIQHRHTKIKNFKLTKENYAEYTVLLQRALEDLDEYEESL